MTDLSTPTLPELLASNPVFADSDPDLIRALVEDAVLLDLSDQHRFICEGDPPHHVDVLVEGTVRVFHQHPSGRQVTVKHLSAPSTLGEMQAMADLSFIENAENLTPAKIVRIPSGRFKAFLRADPRATLVLLGDVCTRFCIAARNEKSILFEVPARLASLLLSYSDTFSVPMETGTRIRYPLTQETLADGLGAAVRSVRRALAEWKKSQWITTHKGWFVIANRTALEELSGHLRFNINYHVGIEIPEIRVDDSEFGPATTDDPPTEE